MQTVGTLRPESAWLKLVRRDIDPFATIYAEDAQGSLASTDWA